MGLMPIVLLYFVISKISAYSVKRLTDDLIRHVGFDRKGNTYALGTTIRLNYRLRKYNTSSETILNLGANFVLNMLVSNTGDTFLSSGIRTDPSSIAVGFEVEVVRSNSNKVDEIDHDGSFNLFYLDNYDNFFYTKGNGVRIVRPNSTVSVPIRNLEDFSPVGEDVTISDKWGNIYMTVKKQEDKFFFRHALALITKETLKDNIPSATFIDALQDKRQYIHDMKIDEENTLWMTILDLWNVGMIKKYSNGTFKTIHSDSVQIYNKMVQTKERTYIIARSYDYKMKSIYYVNTENEIVEMPELKNLSEGYFDIRGLSDSEGNTYFYTESPLFQPNYNLSSPLGIIITIKANGTEPIPITWETSTKIRYVKVDFNDDIWIVAESGDIYYLKKRETVPILVEDFKGLKEITNIHFDFATKKMYLSCLSGLYIVEKN